MKIISFFLKTNFLFFIFLSTCLSANEIDNFINNYFDAFNNSDSIEFHDKFHNPFIRIINGEKKLISDKKWILGNKINKLDISILPFIRQYRIADVDWFDAQDKLKRLKNILLNFLDSELFNDVMYKYDVWEENVKPVFFPTN